MTEEEPKELRGLWPEEWLYCDGLLGEAWQRATDAHRRRWPNQDPKQVRINRRYYKAHVMRLLPAYIAEHNMEEQDNIDTGEVNPDDGDTPFFVTLTKAQQRLLAEWITACWLDVASEF